MFFSFSTQIDVHFANVRDYAVEGAENFIAAFGGAFPVLVVRGFFDQEEFLEMVLVCEKRLIWFCVYC